jgi:hypothetical protein
MVDVERRTLNVLDHDTTDKKPFPSLLTTTTVIPGYSPQYINGLQTYISTNLGCLPENMSNVNTHVGVSTAVY